VGWVRVDDDFYDHEKFVDLSFSAMGLWVALLAWSNRNLSDGVIPQSIPRRLGADDIAVKELLEAELLEWQNGKPDGKPDGKSIAPDCYLIHDYHDFQPSSDEVAAKRDELAVKRAEAGRKGAERRWQNGKPDGKAIANVWPQPQPQDIPNGMYAKTRKKPAVSCPNPFAPTPENIEKVEAKWPLVNWDQETERFVGWAKAKDQKYVDWQRAWLNWMDNAGTGRYR
jgi:hypothetical protein